MNIFEKIREKLEEASNEMITGYYVRATDFRNKMLEIINKTEQEYNNGWIPVEERLPEHSDDLLLVQCSEKPRSNIELVNAFCLASYTEEGWILEIFPEWKGADVVAWQPLPELYKKGE